MMTLQIVFLCILTNFSRPQKNSSITEKEAEYKKAIKGGKTLTSLIATSSLVWILVPAKKQVH